MIEKLEPLQGLDHSWLNKINELCDIINTIQKEREAERFEIQEWIGILEAVRKSVDTHEKQIDELQDHIADASKKVADRMIGCTTLDIPESYKTDPYTEQQKWIGTLCRCWDSNINDDVWGILQDIKDNKTEKYYLYGIGYEHCEPVKPDDDIIYKGE